MSGSGDYRIQEPSAVVVKLRDDLRFAPQEDGGCLVEDPRRGKFFRLGPAEYSLAGAFDGTRTIGEAIAQSARRLGSRALDLQGALAVCRWLVDAELAHTPASRQAARVEMSARRARRGRLTAKLNPLLIKLPLVNPDRHLSAAVARVGSLLGAPLLALWCAVCAIGIYEAWSQWDMLCSAAIVVFDPTNWLRMAGCWLALKVLHELAHALACKKFGGSVHRAGVALLLFAPVAYVDVTSAWRFTSKWRRIMTAAAGMYVELFAAAVAIIVWSHTADGLMHRLALDVAIMASVGTLLVNANPLVRFDGYFILSDALEIPNLYAGGQQYLQYLFQKHVLALEVSLPRWTKRKKAIIATYAIAALLWRTVLMAALCLAMVGAWSYLGGILAAALIGGWCIWPPLRAVSRSWRAGGGRLVSRGRLLRVGGLIAAAAAVLLLTCLLPGRIRLPAVVDYADLQVVRAETPGFVKRVRVRSGQSVREGQVLLELTNEQVESDLKDVALALSQSEIRARVLARDQQLAKYQAELSQRDALRQKQRELAAAVAELTVRATSAGKITSRNLDALEGQYLEAGAQVAVIGSEDRKELLVPVPQEDVDALSSELGRAVRVATAGVPRWKCSLTEIDPQGAVKLAHPALSARAGGPLAVKQHESHGERTTWELLDPHFTVRVALSPKQSIEVHAGERAEIAFWCSGQSLAGRMLGALRRWTRETIERARGMASAA